MAIGDIIKRNVGTIGISSAALALGGAAGYVVGRKKKSKSTTKKKKSKSIKSTKKKGYGTNKQYFSKGHQKKNGKTVHYTKNGQPYVKMASGKARFIKKSKRK